MAVLFSKTGYEGNYMSTGNEYISLPRIDLSGNIHAVGYFSNDFDACLEYVGRQSAPLICPYINYNDNNIIDNFSKYELISYWIPHFYKEAFGLEINYTIITPITRRGFVCVLNIKNTNNFKTDFQVGFKGTWANVLETCKSLKKLNFIKNVRQHAYEPTSLTFNIQNITNLYTLSMFWDNNYSSSVDYCLLKTNETEKDGDDIYYNIKKNVSLLPGEETEIPLYIGISTKEIAALSVVKELIHQGHHNLLGLLTKWLDRHVIEHEDDKIKQLINENSFYSFFYSQAITIDDDNLVITCARDSKSSFCGLYQDVDSMRWTQRATQLISWTQSRKHLNYAFNIQSENIGQRSRSINGHIVDMGIQLDAICAPILGLTEYINRTGDKSILFNSNTQNNINYIQRLLSAQFDKNVYLLETLISPGGNYSSYPYICMQNIMAWKTYKDLSRLYNIIRDLDKSNEMSAISENIKKDIYKYFVKEDQYGKMFCYATDLNNNYIFGNSKTFSLRIMADFGFIKKNDPIYLNTLKFLNDNPENIPENSTEILHDIINHLLISDVTHIHEDFKKMLNSENNLLQIGSDPCASLCGLLTYALFKCYGAKSPDTAIAMDENDDTEALMYRVPEIKLNSKKARIRG